MLGRVFVIVVEEMCFLRSKTFNTCKKIPLFYDFKSWIGVQNSTCGKWFKNLGTIGEAQE